MEVDAENQEQAEVQQGLANPAGQFPNLFGSYVPGTTQLGSGATTSTAPADAALVPARLQALADIMRAAGRTVRYVGDSIILIGSLASSAAGFPPAGGIYTEVNGAVQYAGFPDLSSSAPATTVPAPPTTTTHPVRLHSDELVTYDGRKRGAEAEAFMFLAKRLVASHSLSVDQYASRMFTDEARSWYVKLLQMHTVKGTVLTWDALWKEFTACFMFDRHPNWEVRQVLLSRRYVQRSDQSVADYMVHFRHTILMATDLSETDQVSWFLAGLVPEIAAECQTDSANKPHTALQALYDSAKAAELKLIALGKRTVQGSSQPVSLNKNHSSSGANLKKPRNAVIQKSRSRFHSTSANSHQGPQGSSRQKRFAGRYKTQHKRARPTDTAERRPDGDARPPGEHTEALQAWLDYCGRNRCHRCGRLGHSKRNCRARYSLSEPQWTKFMTDNPNP